MDELHLRYESRRGFLQSVPDTEVLHADDGRPFARASRSSGLGRIEVALEVLGEPAPAAVLRKAPMTTGAWDVADATGAVVATVTHRWFSHAWHVADADGRVRGEARIGGMRPRGELAWDGAWTASFERASLWTSGLFSTRRVWHARLALTGDPVARLVALVLPIAMDLRERTREQGAAAGGGA